MDLFSLNDVDFRRAARAIKEENRSHPEELTPIDFAHVVAEPKPLQAYRSRRFLVQIYHTKFPDVVRMSVNRTEINTTHRRFKDGITWDELQRVKREVGFGQCDAVEVFPKDTDIVNVANIRHLFVFTKNPFFLAWRNNND